MKTRYFFLIALSIALCGLGSNAASTRAGSQKIQVIYQQQPGGEWQIYLFGVPACDAQRAHITYPKDPLTQPLEIECSDSK